MDTYRVTFVYCFTAGSPDRLASYTVTARSSDDAIALATPLFDQGYPEVFSVCEWADRLSMSRRLHGRPKRRHRHRPVQPVAQKKWADLHLFG